MRKLELPGFPTVLTMSESGQNGIQDLLKALARIFRQESQHKISILLEKGVFPAVSANANPQPIGLDKCLIVASLFVAFRQRQGPAAQARRRHHQGVVPHAAHRG